MQGNRREFLAACAGAALANSSGSLLAEEKATSVGVIEHSYALHAADRKARTGRSFRDDPMAFLEFCRERGANGIQIGVGDLDSETTEKFKNAAGYWEASIRLPRNRLETTEFKYRLRSYFEATGLIPRSIVRTVALEGRRYETFTSERAFREFADATVRSLKMLKDYLNSGFFVLAIENHKDWRAKHLVQILEQVDSEHIGVCLDTGNNLALLEDPTEVVETLAPWAVTTHLKDIAVESFADGFRMSEVPFGEGCLDLKRIVAVLRKARPEIHLNIEMITRDPLEVACLTERYWTTFGDVSGRDLVRTLALVRERASQQPLPRVSGLSPAEKLEREDQNVRRCIAYAREHL
jgi:sugar phosphate isomerase/epimerase